MWSARSFSLLLTLAMSLQIFSTSGDSLPRNETSSEKSPVIVELAIFCDKEFSDIFNQDRQRIINYWAVYLWDINMRFKTLPNLDISFKVTSLNIIANTSDQPYIETERRSNGKVPIGGILRKFGEWIYTHETKFPIFDIAVLIFAAEANDQMWRYDLYGEAACKKSHGIRLHKSTIAIKYKHAWGYDSIGLDRALGRSLGMDCESGLRIDPSINRSPKQFFLPQCSHDDIERYIASPAASCLHRIDNSIPDVLENTTVHPPSFDEQCKMITSNEHATASKSPSENECLLVQCNDEDETFAGNLYPVDNSPCGSNKFCFRGRCLPQGYMFQNVETGKCIKSMDRFESTDYPKLVNCATNPTPLDKLMLIDTGINTTLNQLATPYSTPTGSRNADKCLLVAHGNRLRYNDCLAESLASENLNFEFEWELIWVEPGNKFLLLNVYTNSCATAYYNTDNDVMTMTTCDRLDDKMLWQFLGDNEHSSSGQKSAIAIPPNFEATTETQNDAVDADSNSKEEFSVTASSQEVIEIVNTWEVLSTITLIGLVCGGIVLTLFVVRRARQSNHFVRYEKQGEILCIAEESEVV